MLAVLLTIRFHPTLLQAAHRLVLAILERKLVNNLLSVVSQIKPIVQLAWLIVVHQGLVSVLGSGFLVASGLSGDSRGRRQSFVEILCLLVGMVSVHQLQLFYGLGDDLVNLEE